MCQSSALRWGCSERSSSSCVHRQGLPSLLPCGVGRGQRAQQPRRDRRRLRSGSPPSGGARCRGRRCEGCPPSRRRARRRSAGVGVHGGCACLSVPRWVDRFCPPPRKDHEPRSFGPMRSLSASGRDSIGADCQAPRGPRRVRGSSGDWASQGDAPLPEDRDVRHDPRGSPSSRPPVGGGLLIHGRSAVQASFRSASDRRHSPILLVLSDRHCC